MSGLGLKLPVSVGLVAMAIVAFQICLMEILAIVQWHHFGSMIISIALLGFGASGAGIALTRGWLAPRQATALPLSMVLCGIAMAFSVGIAQSATLRFDSLLLFAEPGQALKLAGTCLVFFVPFFLGAAAIGLALALRKRDIGRIYGASLLGSGLGGPLALVLMGRSRPEAIPALIAILPLLAGLLLMGRRIWVLAAIPPVAWAAFHSPGLILSEFKELRKALDLPGARILDTRNGPFGLLQLVESPALRYAPGVSLLYQDPLPATQAAFLNGDWFGPLLPWKPSTPACILDAAPCALPYALGTRARVLVLDARTGPDVVQALVMGARQVQAVEPNPQAAALIEARIPAGARLTVHRTSSRTYLARDASAHDLIVLPMIDASGLHALTENHLLTCEAATQMLHRLTPTGVLSVSCWMDYPPRNSLRLLATLVEALEREQLDPGTHLAAIRGWRTFTLIVKRSPLRSEEIAKVRRFCEELGFDPAILPGLQASERARFHALQDGRWFTWVDRILARGQVPYEFRIEPATDDRPYFSQFLAWRSLAPLKALYGARAIPFFEIGYWILILTTILLALLAFALILLPLARARMEGRTVVYFGALGTGYMFLEMALIQRLALYLGHPVHATAAVISLMLLFSGWGSLAKRPRALRPVLGGIALLILLYALFLPTVLAGSLALPLPGRVGLTVALIAPLAFWMGKPFPLGLSARPDADIPWAWGINGCLSVIGAPLATIVAVELGCTWVMTLAAVAYGLALATVTSGTP